MDPQNSTLHGFAVTSQSLQHAASAVAIRVGYASEQVPLVLVLAFVVLGALYWK
jgi:hypothetical protein